MLSRVLAPLLIALTALTPGIGLADDEGRPDRGGTIYVMTNDIEGNDILTFERDRAGRLHAVPGGTVETGGLGGSITAPVDPLGSQNALVYDAHLDMLFAVNAGDNTVAAFSTSRPNPRPRPTDLVGSGGFIPVSVAVSEQNLYVLNAGGSGTVATFRISDAGTLMPLGTLDLGLANSTTLPFDQIMAPGQVGIDALARRLIVVNAGGQELLVADLDDDGIPVGPLTSTPTPAPVPFSFDVTRYGNVLVAEASGSVSAFDPPGPGGNLTVTAPAVESTQAATCWIVVQDGGFAYVSNTVSNTLSQYRFTRTGQLHLVDAVAATTGSGPTDMTLADRQRFLYSLDAGSGEISGFRIVHDTGALVHVETEKGLPASLGIQGIASRDR